MNEELLEQVLSQYRLKDENRAGWVLRAVQEPESVADHSWGTALLCFYFAQSCGVDRNRAITMALVHDLAEAETGDIPRRVSADAQPISPEGKSRREAEVMTRYARITPEVARLWQEYESAVTLEAQFVRDMNLIDMCMQALIYERDRRYVESEGRENFPDFAGLDEFFATSEPRLLTECGVSLYTTIAREYRDLRASRGSGH